MKTTNNLGQTIVMMVLMLASIVAVYAINPSQPDGMHVGGSGTRQEINGTVQNRTRGYIYYAEVNQSQVSDKWVAYVGNISGSYAMMSEDGYKLYEWSIVTLTGEVYATKESGRPTVDTDLYGGGIPDWSSVECANSSIINREAFEFNHTSNDEDNLNLTFTDVGFTTPSFYVGEQLVTDSGKTIGDENRNCSGINLFTLSNDPGDTGGGRNWTEVILTDGSKEDSTNTPWGGEQYDVLYAALIENNSVGYNGQNYDFQIMLPQSGVAGSVDNIAFYFFVELV